ncbi:MAG: hypothetical protein HZB46_02810, partial [Solirubrobacterales bacterium]|nr:hypothetical protein [Solirubrobacterales bacterium]
AGERHTARLLVSVVGADVPIAAVSPLSPAYAGLATAPRLVVSPPPVRWRHHLLRVELRCRGEVRRCSGLLDVRAPLGPGMRSVLVGRKRFDVARGRPALVHVRVRRAVRRRIARSQKVNVLVVAYRGSRPGGRTWTAVSYSLRALAPRR